MTAAKISNDLAERCRRIRLLLMDCDGVLTDGRLYFGSGGEELKVFNVRDGVGINAWHAAGLHSGIISGRDSDIVSLRASQLGVEFVYQGTEDKLAAVKEIAATAGLGLDEAAFIGDDSPDVELLQHVGLAVAVADAHSDAIDAAHYVTLAKGGCGAVREVVDLILRFR
jgi:3-deoxy-D-manno-octulosonate 8-phosphate phosphatase (KDO 8-P phosphatase)